MTEIKIKSTALLVLAAVAVMGLALWAMNSAQKADSAAPMGLPSTVGLVRNRSVGPQERIVLFDEQRFCSSRIITARGAPLLLSFASSSVSGVATSSSFLAIPNTGIVQDASSTVAYDGGLYGCGPVGALAYSSTTITVIETN